MGQGQRVLIIGAGSGGISLAARLKRERSSLTIAIIDPQEMHYYQPYWTLVGAGLAQKEVTGKHIAGLIPKGCRLIKDAVVNIDPQGQLVQLKSGRSEGYDVLVVGSGLELNWNAIGGLKGNLGRNGIVSIYDYSILDETAHTIQNFKKGEAIFVMPPVPIKCAGAPQKIMYLAEHVWRNYDVRKDINVNFVSAGKAMFGIPTFAKPLAEIVESRGIKTHFQRKILSVDASAKTVSFQSLDPEKAGASETMPYDLLHVVPPMKAHDFVADSGLSVTEGDAKGWLAVDKFSLQHLTYPNIFGIGDVCGIPNSKTGAAIRKQSPVVSKNIQNFIDGKAMELSYDGYSSCPLVTEIGKVMLAEFGYDGKLLPSFPLDPSIPRRSYWYLKKDFLPLMYWKGMLKGWM